ncbi:MAG: preprotein translocase subunit Sec61beta [Candidatus Heimdallarchaeota archaeon]
MSRRKKGRSKSEAPMPATGAGLIRFYSEADSPGIKMGPTAVFIMTIGLIVVILAALMFFK